MRRIPLLLALLALAGCGGGGAGSPVADGAAEIQATAIEFEFRPDFWLIPGEAGELLVTLQNGGSIEHNLALLNTPIEREEDLDPNAIVFELRAAAGNTASGMVGAPPPGTYQVICSIEGHFAAGMVAELRVGS